MKLLRRIGGRHPGMLLAGIQVLIQLRTWAPAKKLAGATKNAGITVLLFLVLLVLRAAQAQGETGISFQEVFQEASVLPIQHEAYEMTPVAVRLFDDSPETMRALFQPSVVARAVVQQSGRVASKGDMGFESVVFSTPVTPSPSQVGKRAQDFERRGLISLAADEYVYLLELEPKNGKAMNALADLERRQRASERDRDARVKLDALIEKDLQEGIDHFEHNRMDQAVAAFVRVLNLDPGNQKAAQYLKRLEESRP